MLDESDKPVKMQKTLMKLAWLIVLAICGTLFMFLPKAFSASTNTEAEADTAQTLEKIRKKYNFPGLAVIVVMDGKICDRVAVGVRKLGDPTLITTNDVFHIGSCTKSMTATLAAMFIEDGKLRWDTTIVDVFPDLKGKIDKQYEGVTVEQLLTHRGGFSTEPPSTAWKRAREQQGTSVQQRREFIEAVLQKPPQVAPGKKTIYSNQGYAIAGAMLEKLADKPWETLITEQLFKPLHMDSAGFGPPGTPGQVDQPWGHVRQGLSTVSIQEDNPPAISPAGRVHCSLDDLARYTIAHMEGERKGGLLKAETFRKLHTPPPGEEYAFGWVCMNRSWAGGRAIMHNGSNTMWYIVMWLAPEKNFSVIAATNTGVGNTFQGCDDVASAMIDKWLK
jgi:CubicO group peptidase (beta-lactamase class C family)